MAEGRRRGLFGLVGSLTDEAKWFADQRMPYPIERNLRRAAGSVTGDEPVVGTLESAARGIGHAVLDDETDEGQAERREAAERSESADRAALDELRGRVAELNAMVDRLVRERGDDRSGAA